MFCMASANWWWINKHKYCNKTALSILSSRGLCWKFRNISLVKNKNWWRYSEQDSQPSPGLKFLCLGCVRSKVSQSLPVLQCSNSGLQGCRIRWPGPRSKDVWSQKQHWGCSVYLYSSLCSWQNRLSCNTRICRWFLRWHVFQGHSLANQASACLFVRLLVDLSAINKFNSLQEAQTGYI